MSPDQVGLATNADKVNCSLLLHFMQACVKNKWLREKVAAGFDPAYLWRRACRKDPKLMLKKESIRPEFSDEDKQIRYEFAMKMLQQPPEFLHSIVYIDESSVPFKPSAQRQIAVIGEEVVHTDKRVPHHPSQLIQLHYLLAVCYATGLVKLEILSFTKGYHDPIQFFVSVGCCMPHLNWSNSVFQPIAGSVHDEAHVVLTCGTVNCMP